MNRARKAIPTAMICICVAAMWFYIAIPPIELLGGDSVTPKVVRVRDVITVTRNFRATRNTSVYVTRTLVRGDCRKSCEIVDLPSGELALEEGDYRNARREHYIPGLLQDGTWRLVFSIKWEDWLGRAHVLKLPELEIEVVR